MFDDLPETIPHKNKRKLETFAFAAAVQVVLVAGLIVIQMAMPEKLGEFHLLTTLYMAPPPPPPAAPLSRAPEPVRNADPGQRQNLRQWSRCSQVPSWRNLKSLHPLPFQET